jgi:hypothetical protein
MKKVTIICSMAVALFTSALFLSSCSKKAATTTNTTTTPTTTLAANTWTVDGTLYKLSLYGNGWASTDFAPRYGVSDYSSQGNVEQLEINFLAQPTTSGDYTIEEYRKVHLRTITGQFVGMSVQHNNKQYESISASGKVNLVVNGKDIVATLKDVILTEVGGSTTIKVSAHVPIIWKW